MKIIVSQEIEQVCPGFVGACVEAQVENTPYCHELWQEIEAMGERFRRELIRAKDMGTHLYILIENEDGIRTIEDVRSWRNPRIDYSSRAITGERLARAMRTMQERYGCTFLFCEPQRAAAYIFKILERGI